MKLIRVAMLVLALALTASVALNVVIYGEAKKYYLQLNEARLEPIGLGYYPTDGEEGGEENDGLEKVIFFGDSRVYEWPAPDLSQFEFINRGIGAQTSAQVIARFDAHVAPLQPQVVILQVCINDLKTIPLFPYKKEKIIANCKANIQQVVEKSIDLGADVILTTVIPSGKLPIERRPFWSDEVAIAIDEVNAYIHSLAGPDVLVFDTTAVLVDEDGIIQESFSRDFLHLNSLGYEALNRELEQILLER